MTWNDPRIDMSWISSWFFWQFLISRLKFKLVWIKSRSRGNAAHTPIRIQRILNIFFFVNHYFAWHFFGSCWTNHQKIICLHFVSIIQLSCSILCALKLCGQLGVRTGCVHAQRLREWQYVLNIIWLIFSKRVKSVTRRLCMSGYNGS